MLTDHRSFSKRLIGSGTARLLLILLCCVLFSAIDRAQAAGQTQVPVAGSDTPTPTPDPAASVKRWLDISSFTVSTRYRYIRNQNGIVAANQNQYQISAKWKFKFDAKGRYSVGFGLLTGNSFIAGWNNTGWGTGSGHADTPLRQLYFDARPVDGVEVQVGGLSFNLGENTEVTGYDSDAYLVGERVQITRPKKLYFDEISFTHGYVGDLTRPDVFHRLHRLGHSNYGQILVRKKLNKYVSASADYTYQAGNDTLRQALKFTLPKGKILDTVLFENYERIDPRPGYGFNLAGQKKFNKYVTAIAGIARIDEAMRLNGDRYPPGNHLYFNGTVRLSREFSVTAYLNQGVGTIIPHLPRTRFEVILTYNVLETLHRLKLQ